jgi:hypothetical protein
MPSEQKQAVAFDLPYYVNFRAYYVAAYMTRKSDALGDDDVFTVHRLSDDVVLGSEYTKDDAIHNASYRYPREFDLTTV